jgi:hypothetical protein
MSRLGLETFSRVLWPLARRPYLAAASAVAAGKRRLKSAESRVQRRIEASLREALIVLVLVIAGLVIALAGGIFLLMGVWDALAVALGPIGASLTLAVVLLSGSFAPLVLAVQRVKGRRHVGQ